MFSGNFRASSLFSVMFRLLFDGLRYIKNIFGREALNILVKDTPLSDCETEEVGSKLMQRT